MMRYLKLEHRFGRSVPRDLEPGVLYISMEYGTAVHSCCCGCGERAVTPFSPTGWKMTYDGMSVSFFPSIGNWNSACRPHYVIDRGRVIEADRWRDAKVAAEGRRDKAAKSRFYKNLESIESPAPGIARATEPAPVLQSDSTPGASDEWQSSGWWTTVRRWALGQLPTARSGSDHRNTLSHPDKSVK
jgi:hypothetical protein